MKHAYAALIAASLVIAAQSATAAPAHEYRLLEVGSDYGGIFWDPASLTSSGAQRDVDVLEFEVKSSWTGVEVVRDSTTFVYRMRVHCDWGTVQALPQAFAVDANGRRSPSAAPEWRDETFLLSGRGYLLRALRQEVCVEISPSWTSVFPTINAAVAYAKGQLSAQPMMAPSIMMGASPVRPAIYFPRFGTVWRDDAKRGVFIDWGSRERAGDSVTVKSLWVLPYDSRREETPFALRTVRFDCSVRTGSVLQEQFGDIYPRPASRPPLPEQTVDDSPVMAALFNAACTGVEPAEVFTNPDEAIADLAGRT